MTNTARLRQLYKLLDEAEMYERMLGKLDFDLQCCAPPEGMEQAEQDAARLEQLPFKLTHSAKYVRLVTELHQNPEGLTPLQKKLVEHLWERYEKTKNFTPAFALARSEAYNRAYSRWLEAKKQNDYSLFRDSFRDVIDFTRRSIDLRDEKKATWYDACLDDYEKGGSIAQMDAFFDRVKARVLPLIRRIREEGRPIREDFLTRPCAIPKQEQFSHYLLELEGLRKDALVLMTTEHPFTTNFGPHDVRVTTHYYEEQFVSNIFTTMHEGGHALFMQNEPPEFYENHVADSMTAAMHECVSRFYENIIARSRAFIHAIFSEFQKLCGREFGDVTEEELYRAVNIARPGLIRMEADELTYCVHILIRYELEKAFVNGLVTVEELPALWNAKYKEYLGLDVPDDARGILQDVHWSGSYGYFPSYALGSAYGAQILRRMEKDFDVYGAVAAGDVKKVTQWMTEHVFSVASISTPAEWIVSVTGEDFDPDYFLDYLEEKFTALYQLPEK